MSRVVFIRSSKQSHKCAPVDKRKLTAIYWLTSMLLIGFTCWLNF